jgi:hypothetical protein
MGNEALKRMGNEALKRMGNEALKRMGNEALKREALTSMVLAPRAFVLTSPSGMWEIC